AAEEPDTPKRDMRPPVCCSGSFDRPSLGEWFALVPVERCPLGRQFPHDRILGLNTLRAAARLATCSSAAHPPAMPSGGDSTNFRCIVAVHRGCFNEIRATNALAPQRRRTPVLDALSIKPRASRCLSTQIPTENRFALPVDPNPDRKPHGSDSVASEENGDIAYSIANQNNRCPTFRA